MTTLSPLEKANIKHSPFRAYHIFKDENGYNRVREAWIMMPHSERNDNYIEIEYIDDGSKDLVEASSLTLVGTLSKRKILVCHRKYDCEGKEIFYRKAWVVPYEEKIEREVVIQYIDDKKMCFVPCSELVILGHTFA